MNLLPAPEGFEAGRCWIDGTKEWQVYWRRKGETFWTPARYIGYDALGKQVLDERGAAEAERAIFAPKAVRR